MLRVSYKACTFHVFQETHELQRKQAWYQQNQVSMQKDDEEEYLNYCSEAMFRIHILELRLNRLVPSQAVCHMFTDTALESINVSWVIVD